MFDEFAAKIDEWMDTSGRDLLANRWVRLAIAVLVILYVADEFTSSSLVYVD